MSSIGAGDKTVAIRDVVLGDGKPKICVPLTAHSARELEEQLELVMQVPCSMVELRADYFDQQTLTDSLEEILRLVREEIREKVLLFTFRTRAEGGERAISYEEYRRLNLRAADSGVDIVDLELFTILSAQEPADADAGQPGADAAPADADAGQPDADAAPADADAGQPGANAAPASADAAQHAEHTLVKELHARGCKVIGSSHDFRKTPETEEMVGRLVCMQELGMDITKLAVMPQTRQDVVRLLDATVRMQEIYADRPFVTMAMGSLGVVTRCIGGFSGSAFTFAAAAGTSAPGQISAEKMAGFLELAEEVF